MRKKEKQEKNSIIFLGWLIIAIAILFIAIAIIIDNFVPDDCAVWEGAFTLIVNVGATAATVGGGTVLYSYFDFVNYISDKIRKIIVEYDFVKQLDKKEKENLLKKISNDLIYKNENCGEDTLYGFVTKEVQELAQGWHYESMNLIVHCRHEKKEIIKTIDRTFLINYTTAPGYVFDIQALTKCYFCPRENGESPYNITLLEINEEKFNKYLQLKHFKESEYDGYEHTYYYTMNEEGEEKLKEVLSKAGNRLKVQMKYTTIVPENDTVMTFRVHAPCKTFSSTFVYDNSIKCVQDDIFTFKDRAPSNQRFTKDRITFMRNPGCCHTNVNNWILPGDGVIYIITPQNSGADVPCRKC